MPVPDLQRYKQTVAPTAEPVTLHEAVLQCRVVDEAEWPYLQALIQKARRHVEKRLSRQLMPAAYQLFLDGFPCDPDYSMPFLSEIELRILPVFAVTWIKYIDLNGDQQTFPLANAFDGKPNYQVDLVSPDLPARIRPAYGRIWPYTRPATYNTVTVEFLAGYGRLADDGTTILTTPVPETTKHAILMLVGHLFNHREAAEDEQVYSVPHGFDALLDMDSWGRYR